jgi:hypothetical protein
MCLDWRLGAGGNGEHSYAGKAVESLCLPLNAVTGLPTPVSSSKHQSHIKEHGLTVKEHRQSVSVLFQYRTDGSLGDRENRWLGKSNWLLESGLVTKCFLNMN